MTTAGEPAIEFMHSDLVREVELMSKLAAPFVTAETHWRFGRIKGELQNLAQGRDLAWEIPLESPLVTEPSYGDYEVKQGGKGTHAVVARVSFLWHVRGVGSPLRVRITGNATTRLTLVDALTEPATELAMWRLGVGGPDSPGCCFHIQVLGNRDAPPFPHSLPVPRLPSFPATPMGAFEFVLGEIFQAGWNQRVGRNEPSARDWRGIQRPRWQAFLLWQHDAVSRTSASPWIALKGFPSALFVQ